MRQSLVATITFNRLVFDLRAGILVASCGSALCFFLRAGVTPLHADPPCASTTDTLPHRRAHFRAGDSDI